MNQPFISNIQKYSIHDGAGIRTTVFFKGCPLSCVWCHNPETKKFEPQMLFQEERCTGCGSCVQACPSHAISIQNGIAITAANDCNQCGVCLDYCLQNIREISGKYYTVDELIVELEKDKVFYEQSGGGITLSGGEVLSQGFEYLVELLTKLHIKGYSVNIDTTGFASFDIIEKIYPYVDTFLYDIKLMDSQLHKKYIGVPNELILDNLMQLSKKGAKIWIRIPVIGSVNNTDLNMQQTAEFLKKEQISVRQINLLPYHNTASSKYKRLQIEYQGEDFYTPDPAELEHFTTIFQQYGFNNIKIGG